MGSLNEIRNMKSLVQAAALRKQELDMKNSGQHVSNSIKSAVERKKQLTAYSSRERPIFRWMSPAMVSCTFLACAGTFLGFSLYQNVFASSTGSTYPFLKAGDYKRAENFVDSFLRGNLSVQAYYSPERKEILMKSATGLLPSFSGIPASVMAVCEKDDNKSFVLKATCPKGAESAIIYLTQSGVNYHVSGIEIEKRYADEESRD